MKKVNLNDVANLTFQLVLLDGCLICELTQTLLEKLGCKMDIVNFKMNDKKSKNDWNNFVKKNFNKSHNTFPKIFLEGHFIGGYDDLQKIFR